MKLAQQRIIRFTLLVEASLVAISLVWASSRALMPPLVPTWNEIGWGLVFVAPLVFVNLLLFGPLANSFVILKRCQLFRDQVLVPLALQLDITSALIVSISAGIGEELFFRYMLQTEFGIFIASLLFAVLHFGPIIVNYYFIASIYLLFGLYFGAIFAATGSIWTAVITHAVYDFVALCYLKRVHLRQVTGQNTAPV